MDRKKIGEIGEKYAENLLASQGYCILDRNFRWREGEIDIVAMENSSNSFGMWELTFIEVKTRTNEKFGHIQESISWRKKQKIIRTALHFMSLLNPKTSLSWRIDVITVKLDRAYKLKEITHIKNAFNG